MAFQDELVPAQASPFTADFRRRNEQLVQQEWLQLITSQHSPTIEPTRTIHHHTKRELLPPTPDDPPNTLNDLPNTPDNLPNTPNDPLNTDHERHVQRIACRLSKKTLQQYLNIIPVPLPLPTGSSYLDILPQAIIDQICSNVPYEDLLVLYQQSRLLHRLIDPHLAPYHTKLSFVLRAERDFRQHWTQTPPNLGCYTCARVLPASFFASRQTLHALLRPSPRDPPTTVCLRRFCVHCGIRTGCHGRGDSLVLQTGAQCWLCDCLRVHPEDATNFAAVNQLNIRNTPKYGTAPEQE
ncbi:hypothetical protein F4821DRAFT_258224 [Hypoxylon rubiginosum]|uniref:Uncharacterized protein n=1 Tax=Hypoxylon rubiginosum TaxID=110542 RepID=A0ACC0D647_9PEZI|nr:hypothetical protein F4821DRAFT_258224 [Hypoxylon rubiginosum]